MAETAELANAIRELNDEIRGLRTLLIREGFAPLTEQVGNVAKVLDSCFDTGKGCLCIREVSRG